MTNFVSPAQLNPVVLETVTPVGTVTHVLQALRRQLANTSLLFLSFELCGQRAEEEGQYAIHALFAQLAKNLQTVFDGIADRVPAFDLTAILDEASISYSPFAVDYPSALATATANQQVVIDELRESIAGLSERDEDPVSIAILDAALKVHQRQQVFLPNAVGLVQ